MPAASRAPEGVGRCRTSETFVAHSRSQAPLPPCSLPKQVVHVTLSPLSLNRFVIGAVASGEAGAQYAIPGYGYAPPPPGYRAPVAPGSLTGGRAWRGGALISAITRNAGRSAAIGAGIGGVQAGLQLYAPHLNQMANIRSIIESIGQLSALVHLLLVACSRSTVDRSPGRGALDCGASQASSRAEG